jgi:hypothetical protein
MGMAVAVAATFPAGAAQRVNLTIDLLQHRVSDRVLAWLKVGGALLLLVFYALLAWRIGVYAQKLQERAAETIFVQMPIAPFVWTVAVFVAVSALAQTIALFVSVRHAIAGIAGPDGWSIGPVDDAPRIAPGGQCRRPAGLRGGLAIIAAAAIALIAIHGRSAR